jgi:DNA polymerase
MGLDSLRDLELAGAIWELTDNPAAGGPEKTSPDKAEAAGAKTSAPLCAAAAGAMIPPSAPAVLSRARESATGAGDSLALLAAIENSGHPLKQFAKNTVAPHFAAADSDSGLLIITDAPSADDDESGKILTGAAGDLMDKMLAAIGLGRGAVSIAPLVFWRAPGGRTPAREELDLARPFVDRAAALLKPKAILTLGVLTAAEIANARLPKDHGKQFETADRTPVIPIYHPNYLMLKPDAKKDAWEALQKLQNLLKND